MKTPAQILHDHFSALGKVGGAKSKRVLTKEQAKAMSLLGVKARAAKRQSISSPQSK